MGNKAEHTNIRIKGIEILESSLNLPKENLQEKPAFNFNINLEQTVLAEPDTLAVICHVEIFLQQSKDELLGNFKSACLFHVQGLASYTGDPEKPIDLPDNLNFALNSITFSTTRGMMFTYFRGTSLHNAILPVVDPKMFVVKSEGKE